MAEIAARAPVSAWYALAVLVLTTVFAFVDKQILNLLAPSLQQSLGLSDLELGTLQGLGLAIFASIASYPFGWLADRYGRRLLLAIGAAIWSLSTAACAFQNDFAGLFVATIGIAAGEAGLTPIIFALIPDLFPGRQRNTANFIYFAAALLGAAAGMALGGLTLNWVASAQHLLPSAIASLETWRVAMLIAAAPGPIFVILILSIRVATVPSQSADSPADSPAASEQTTQRLLPYVKAHWKTLCCLLGAIGACNFALNSSGVWLSLAMPRVFGTDPAEFGVQMGITLGIATIAGLTLPALGSRFLGGASPLNSVNLGRLFLFAATGPTLLLLFAAAPWQAYVGAGGQLMLGVATAALMPGILQNITPRPLRARVIAMLGIVQGIAQGVSPLLVGTISGLIPSPRGILMAIVMVGLPGWLIGALLLSLSRRHLPITMSAVQDGIGEQSVHAPEVDPNTADVGTVGAR